MREISSQKVHEDQRVLVRKQGAAQDHVVALRVHVLVVEHLDEYFVDLHLVLVVNVLIVLRSDHRGNIGQQPESLLDCVLLPAQLLEGREELGQIRSALN